MNDANDDQEMLKGLLRDVQIHINNVSTTNNIYVEEQVPFDLLLERP